MVPVYVPGESEFGVAIPTFNVEAVPLAVPLAGVTVSQFPPVAVVGDAVNVVVPPVAVRVTACVAGAVVAPCATVKAKDVGV